jgi:small subunit ribosomal protein S6
MLRHYEILFLVHPDQSEQVPAMLERYQALIKREGGQVDRLEDWGRCQLAYPIRKLHKAHYILMNVTCNQTTLNELVHLFRFSDAILRHLIVVKKEVIVGPSPRLKIRDAQAESAYQAAELDASNRDIGRFRRKKQSPFASKDISEIDYKNVELLKNCITETSKIIPSRITGAPAKFQRRAALAIKRARFVALLPYCDHH